MQGIVDLTAPCGRRYSKCWHGKQGRHDWWQMMALGRGSKHGRARDHVLWRALANSDPAQLQIRPCPSCRPPLRRPEWQLAEQPWHQSSRRLWQGAARLPRRRLAFGSAGTPALAASPNSRYTRCDSTGRNRSRSGRNSGSIRHTSASCRPAGPAGCEAREGRCQSGSLPLPPPSPGLSCGTPGRWRQIRPRSRPTGARDRQHHPRAGRQAPGEGP
mmetsp:Transcript_106996/g.255400  ORF Transcript_106996/g.255400 Transcript_106996/m.255400 type:complete len:216 (-) Transcript_106996:1088-1735(-)